MAGWGLVLLCCVHLTAQGVPPGNGAASLSTAIAIVPILGSGGSWAAASPCSRVWDQGAMTQGFGRAKHHPWLFSWLSGISLARLCFSMPHDNQLQTDVGFTGRTGEDLCADVQRWDLQHVGAFTVCFWDSPRPALSYCPQSAHWDQSACAHQSGKPPGECFGVLWAHGASSILEQTGC